MSIKPHKDDGVALFRFRWHLVALACQCPLDFSLLFLGVESNYFMDVGGPLLKQPYPLMN